MPSSNDLYALKRQLYAVSDSQGMETLKEFATMKVEMIKQQLCECPLESVRDLQGQATAYSELLDALTQAPIELD